MDSQFRECFLNLGFARPGRGIPVLTPGFHAGKLRICSSVLRAEALGNAGPNPMPKILSSIYSTIRHADAVLLRAVPMSQRSVALSRNVELIHLMDESGDWPTHLPLSWCSIGIMSEKDVCSQSPNQNVERSHNLWDIHNRLLLTIDQRGPGFLVGIAPSVFFPCPRFGFTMLLRLRSVKFRFRDNH